LSRDLSINRSAKSRPPFRAHENISIACYLPDGFVGAKIPPAAAPPIEFPRNLAYPKDADEFVHQETPCAHRLAER